MPHGAKYGGRKKGTPNRSTERVRSAIGSFADANAEKFGRWVEQVAAEDPKEAAKLYLQAIEYHIPKLARTEQKGEVDMTLRIEHAGSPAQLPASQVPARITHDTE